MFLHSINRTRKKVAIPWPIVASGVEFLQKNGIEVIAGNSSADPRYLKNFLAKADPDALLARTPPYPAEVLSCAKNLKAIGRFGVGIDNIDLEYCKKNGIMVTIAPGANSNSVAEHTVMFILTLARKAVIQNEKTRNGNYDGRRE